ncbi:hypothetical protein BURK2_04045 [Burkholderiales bacterium]|nr:hypothetical protein BURK2_04045 [Burkholderiales bacterium]
MSPSHLMTPLLGLFIAAPALAQSLDLPARKDGLWQMSTASAGSPPSISTMCIDKTFGKEMMQMGSGMQKEMCSKHDLKREGNKVHMHSVCKFGETLATTQGTAVFSGDTGYRMDMHTLYNPPVMGMKEAKTTIEAKWLGPCKPGQKPGDVTMANGMTINMRGMGGMGGKGN